MPPEATDPIGLGFGPGDPANGDGISSDTTTAAGDLPGQIAEDGSAGLRVVDPSTPPGLVETIVGNVTGFYLGR